MYNNIPDICQSVGLLSRFMEKPQESHLKAVKRVLQYIKGTINHGVLMPRQKINFDRAEVHGYANSDFNGDQDDVSVSPRGQYFCYLYRIIY